MEIFIFTTLLFLATSVALVVSRLRREQEISATLEQIVERLETMGSAMSGVAQTPSQEIIDQVIAEHLDNGVQKTESEESHLTIAHKDGMISNSDVAAENKVLKAQQNDQT